MLPSTDPDALVSGFLRSARRFPGRPALELGDESLTYSELHSRAGGVAAALAGATPAGGAPLTAVLGARSATAFAGVLGALLRGHGYVPLNPRFPAARNADMLRRAGCRALVVDAGAFGQLDALIAHVERPLLVVLPDDESPGESRRRWPEHTVLGAREIQPDRGVEPVATDPDAVAYLLFTSGSTGTPKGVGVAHRNVRPFIHSVVERYHIAEHDRVSQTFDLTFDLSVFDMFVAWERGACLCCPSQKALMAPGGFIRDSKITVWFSVPSTAIFMRRLGMLKPGAYPTLRWSLFCGEALPARVAGAFGEAAPNSTLENLYGPTEATIACTAYRWHPERSPAECVSGIVPIGAPLPGMSALVVDSKLQEVDLGDEGELLVAGPQVTPGYWLDAERTAQSFVVPPGSREVHYRTGDRVRRADPLTYVGRLDGQLKVLGHRVELGEVDAVLRDESGVDAAVAVGWPPTDSGAAGIVAFLGDVGVDVGMLRVAMAERLPDYMVPRRFELLPELPLNANGKFDRKNLLESLGHAREPSAS